MSLGLVSVFANLNTVAIMELSLSQLFWFLGIWELLAVSCYGVSYVLIVSPRYANV